jgi:hypothetical protein
LDVAVSILMMRRFSTSISCGHYAFILPFQLLEARLLSNHKRHPAIAENAKALKIDSDSKKGKILLQKEKEIFCLGENADKLVNYYF